MYDLFPTMDMRTYVPDYRHEEVISNITREDLYCEEYVVMCLDSDKLLDLCELYPGTALSLKYRALDRRAYFLRE